MPEDLTNFFQLISDFWLKITPKNQQVIIASIVFFVVVFLIYIFWLLYSRRSNLLQPRYFLRFSYLSNSDEVESFENDFYSIFSKLHSNHKGITTFEIHKQKDFEGFIVSSPDLSVLESIKLDLSTIQGTKFDDIISNSGIPSPTFDPLVSAFSNPKKPFQTQLLSSIEYGNFRTDKYETVKNLINYITRNNTNDYSSIIFSFLPNRHQSKIRSLIAKLNHESSRRSSEYQTGPNQNVLRHIKELDTKNLYALFSCRIVLLSTNKDTVKHLSSCFSLVSSDNKFNGRISNFNPAQIRFVPKQNLFTAFNRSAFGVEINSKELSGLVQLSTFGVPKKSNNEID